MNMDWPVWELPSSSAILNLARMIIPYIRFLHPSIVDAVVADNEKHREVWKRNLRGCPACFLILKGVVISSHETNRFS